MIHESFFPTKAIATRKAGQKLTLEVVKHRTIPILLLVSGGSALNILQYVDASAVFPHMTIGVLDERMNVDSAMTNFTQLEHTSFFQKAKKHGAHVICPPADFEENLRLWRHNNSKGTIVITQGIGPDGHTAGIMPYPEDPDMFQKLFVDTTRWVVEYDVGSKNQYPLRATVTVPFLREVDVSVLFVAGKEKRSTLQRVLAPSGSLAQTPARAIHHMKNVFLFTDIVL